MELAANTTYVCPAAHDIIIKPDATLDGERVEYVRPSIDWLFETAAAVFSSRTIALAVVGHVARIDTAFSWTDPFDERAIEPAPDRFAG